jgi:hypothetical protein
MAKKTKRRKNRLSKRYSKKRLSKRYSRKRLSRKRLSKKLSRKKRVSRTKRKMKGGSDATLSGGTDKDREQAALFGLDVSVYLQHKAEQMKNPERQQRREAEAGAGAQAAAETDESRLAKAMALSKEQEETGEAAEAEQIARAIALSNKPASDEEMKNAYLSGSEGSDGSSESSLASTMSQGEAEALAAVAAAAAGSKDHGGRKFINVPSDKRIQKIAGDGHCFYHTALCLSKIQRRQEGCGGFWTPEGDWTLQASAEDIMELRCKIAGDLEKSLLKNDFINPANTEMGTFRNYIVEADDGGRAFHDFNHIPAGVRGGKMYIEGVRYSEPVLGRRIREGMNGEDTVKFIRENIAPLNEQEDDIMRTIAANIVKPGEYTNDAKHEEGLTALREVRQQRSDLIGPLGMEPATIYRNGGQYASFVEQLKTATILNVNIRTVVPKYDRSSGEYNVGEAWKMIGRGGGGGGYVCPNFIQDSGDITIFAVNTGSQHGGEGAGGGIPHFDGLIPGDGGAGTSGAGGAVAVASAPPAHLVAGSASMGYADHSGGVAGGENWDCSSCTFINDQSNEKCEMCGLSPVRSRIIASELEPEPEL